MTEEVFRQDAYARSCEARVTAVDEAGVRLDRTVFYPLGGGQPGDSGELVLHDGTAIRIIDTRKGTAPDEIVHVPEASPDPALAGSGVTARIDWDRRHRLMRIHTCLHLLCSLIPAPVTGGSIRDGSGRLDFDLPESTLDKQDLTTRLNRLVAEDHPVNPRWVSEGELDANPSLVRTMSVAPPARPGKRAAARHRRRGLAALRRHPRGLHRRDRAGAGDEDREEGPPEPSGDRRLRPLTGAPRTVVRRARRVRHRRLDIPYED